MLFASLLLAAGAADHGGDHHINWIEIAALWINFFILVWLVPKVVRGMTGKGPIEHLKSQRDELAAQLQEAKTKQDAAEKRLAEYVHKLEHLEDEVRSIVANFEAQGEADRKRLEQDAEKAIERLAREADFSIRQESLQAQKEIRTAGVEATLRIAEELVKERITDADRRRLTDEYIGAVDSGQTTISS
jgi:F-type H+-transporting ATPase subunit b